MTVDLQWLIGTAITLFLAWISILVGAFWRLLSMIRKGDDTLHSRINRVREDTAHKSDLSDFQHRISDELKELRKDQNVAATAMNTRLDTLLSAIASRNTRNGD